MTYAERGWHFRGGAFLDLRVARWRSYFSGGSFSYLYPFGAARGADGSGGRRSPVTLIAYVFLGIIGTRGSHVLLQHHLLGEEVLALHQC